MFCKVIIRNNMTKFGLFFCLKILKHRTFLYGVLLHISIGYCTYIETDLCYGFSVFDF